MSLCKNEKNSKRGTDEEKKILSFNENENLKTGDRKKTNMSLCENEKNQKGGRTEKKSILSLYENKNLKKGDRKRIKKKNLCRNIMNSPTLISKGETEKNTKKTCFYAKMKKIKKGDGRNKKHFIPV
jgi:hypothetical protein